MLLVWLAFIVGLFLGAFLGMLVIALCHMAHEDDRN